MTVKVIQGHQQSQRSDFLVFSVTCVGV